MKILDTRQHIDKKPPREYEEWCPALNSTMYKEPYLVLDIPKSTSTPPKSSSIITQMSKTMATAKKSTGLMFPTLTCLQGEVHARTFLSLESVQELSGKEVDLFGSSSDVLKKKNLSILSGRMLKECLVLGEDSTSQTYSLRFPKQGILSGGRFSTPKTSVSLKTESVSLSSVLETEVPQKYFLSEEQTERIFRTLNQEQTKPTDDMIQTESVPLSQPQGGADISL